MATLPVVLVEGTVIFYKSKNVTVKILITWHQNKNVRIWSYSGPHFPAFELNISLSISPYSVRKRENTDQNNSEYGHFLRSVNKPNKNSYYHQLISIETSNFLHRMTKKLFLRTVITISRASGI